MKPFNSASSVPSSSAVTNITICKSLFIMSFVMTYDKKQKTNHNDQEETHEVDFKQKWVELLKDAEQNKNSNKYR
ncbi:hypothetical protein PS15m_010553 [Mucor circinelloides]